MRGASTVESALLAAVLDGREPAEALPANRNVREQVVRRLTLRGMDDVEIAAWTGWTAYTVQRIRVRAAARRGVQP